MRLTTICSLLLAPLALWASPSLIPPVGVYRSAAQFRQQRPQPAGRDVRPSDKRDGYVVKQDNGRGKRKVVVPADSVWGYVDGNGRMYRVFAGQTYEIQRADTLTLYSALPLAPGGTGEVLGSTGRRYGVPQYFFSQGIDGVIFPLEIKNLRLAYAETNPEFVLAAEKLGFFKSLTDYDRDSDTYRVERLYRNPRAAN